MILGVSLPTCHRLLTGSGLQGVGRLEVVMKLVTVCMDCGKPIASRDGLSEEAIDRLFAKIDRGSDSLSFDGGKFISESVCNDCADADPEERYD